MAWVTGEFGAGKSTLLERLKFRLACAYVAGESTIRPILVKLRYFQNQRSLDGLLRASLEEEFQQPADLQAFWKSVDNGSCVLLLDGFDEMDDRVDDKRRSATIRNLVPLMGLSSPVIISGRPSYFVSKEQLAATIRSFAQDLHAHRIAARSPQRPDPRTSASSSQDDVDARRREEAFRTRALGRFLPSPSRPQWAVSGVDHFELQPLSSRSIDHHLRAHEALFVERGWRGWRHVRTTLRAMLDEGELLRRPILLAMAIDTVLAGVITPHTNGRRLGRAKLYDLYTDLKLDLEEHKGRTLLHKEQRKRFSEALATVMLRNERGEVDSSEVQEVVRLVSEESQDLDQVLESATIEQVAMDIQMCSFIEHSQVDASFRFSHRSFFEYFAASSIHRKAMHGQAAGELSLPLKPEVLYFLASFASADRQALLRYTQWLADPEISAPLRRNLFTIALLVDGELPPIYASEPEAVTVSAKHVDLRKARITRPRLEDLVAERLTLSQSVVRDSTANLLRIDRLVLCDSELDMNLTEGTCGVAFSSHSSLSITGKSNHLQALRLRASECSLEGVDFRVDRLRLRDDATIELSGVSVQHLGSRSSEVRLSQSAVESARMDRSSLAIRSGELQDFTMADCRSFIAGDDAGGSGRVALSRGWVRGGIVRLAGMVELSEVHFQDVVDAGGDHATLVSCSFSAPEGREVSASGALPPPADWGDEESANRPTVRLRSSELRSCTLRGTRLEAADSRLSNCTLVQAELWASGSGCLLDHCTVTDSTLVARRASTLEVLRKHSLELRDCTVLGAVTDGVEHAGLSSTGIRGFVFLRTIETSDSNLPVVPEDPVDLPRLLHRNLLALPYSWVSSVDAERLHQELAAFRESADEVLTSYLDAFLDEFDLEDWLGQDRERR